MTFESAVLPFPKTLVFPDVDPPVLARDEGYTLDARSLLDGVWREYMMRMLPPVGGRVGRATGMARAKLVWSGPDRFRRA